MEKLTKERAHDLCVEMWNDIAENGYFDKRQSYLIKKYKPEDACFACEYYICPTCPFTEDDDDGCSEDNSPYTKWVDKKPKSGKIARRYAIAIADIFI